MATGPQKTEVGKKSRFGWLLVAVVGFLAAGAGVAASSFLSGGLPSLSGLGGFGGSGGHHSSHHGSGSSHGKEDKLAVIPFDGVAVNLATERLTRYLRIKLVLVVNSEQKDEITDLVKRKHSFLKSWLIGYLADQTIEDIKGTAGVNRIRREIQDQFNSMLFPDGPESIHDVLFEEFLIQ